MIRVGKAFSYTIVEKLANSKQTVVYGEFKGSGYNEVSKEEAQDINFLKNINGWGKNILIIYYPNALLKPF